MRDFPRRQLLGLGDTLEAEPLHDLCVDHQLLVDAALPADDALAASALAGRTKESAKSLDALRAHVTMRRRSTVALSALGVSLDSLSLRKPHELLDVRALHDIARVEQHLGVDVGR